MAIIQAGEKLTAKYPKSLEEVAQEFEVEFKKVGGTVTEFSAEDQATWKSKIAKPIFEDYVTNMEKKGIPKVREIVGRFATLMGYQF